MTGLATELGTPPRLLALEPLLVAVCGVYQLPVSAILSPTRSKAIVEARQCVYLLARRCTRLSFPEIGRALGRDHTTVMSGVAAIERRLLTDRWLAGAMAELLEQFGDITTGDLQ